MDAIDADVIVAGAGPTGLMIAAELGLLGVSTIVVERREEPMRQSRALGFSARAIEEFDQRGLLSRFGQIDTIPIGHFGGLPIDFQVLPGGSYGARGIPQSRTEAVLTDWARSLGADIRRQHTVTGLQQDRDAVEVEVQTPAGARTLRARYLIGCDGARSVVRQLAGIDFPGTEPVIEMWLADVSGVALTPRFSGERVPGGMVMVLPAGPGVFRVGLYERAAGVRNADTAPSFEEVADAWQRLTGEDIHAATAHWVSWFTDASRQASDYRNGRVFLAGDAAHVHLPQGAQGMSGGIGDAMNLGWKLAAQIRGSAPAELLDSYHLERQPVGARVLTNTLAQRILYLSGEELDPVRDLFTELLGYQGVQRHLAGMVSGQDIRYGEEADPIGRRLPNYTLLGDFEGGDRTTVFQQLRPARAILLDLTDDPEIRQTARAWSDRVDIVTGSAQPGIWTELDGVDAALVRPDGYIAWVNRPGSGPAGLPEALSRWFGQPQLAVAST